MKLIDRHVTGSFLKNYLISFMVMVGIYVVLDMIFNFKELVEVSSKQEVKGGLPAAWSLTCYIADYYFYQSFLYFKHLAGIIPIVAASFTLMRMVRFNELSALLSAGVPLVRIATPIILVSLLLNGLLWVDQEMVIPNLIPKLERDRDYGADTEGQAFSISAMPDGNGGKLFAGKYRPQENPPRMEYISVVQVTSDNQPIGHIKADLAFWDRAGGGWKLQGGLRDVNLDPKQGLAIKSEPTNYYQSTVNPESIQLFRSGDFVELLSTQRIDELLQDDTYGRNALLRVKHTRGAAQIILNMILLLLTIACVLTRDPLQLKAAASRCVLITGICSAVAFLGQQMGGRPPLDPSLADKWPALMAWLPIFIFGPISVWMLDRVKT